MWALVSDCDKQQAQSIRRTSAAAAAAGASGAAWMGRWMDGETRAGRGVHHAAAGSLTRAAAAGQAAGRPSRRGLEAAREPGCVAGMGPLWGLGAVEGGGALTWNLSLPWPRSRRPAPLGGAAAAGQAAGRPSRRGLEAAREPGRSAGSDLLGGVGAVLGGFGRATWRVATGGTFATTVGERGISGGWRAEESIAWTLRMRLQHSWGCSERAVNGPPPLTAP